MRRLYRSQTDRKIAGICGGLGEMFSLDPTLIRLALVLIALLGGLVPVVITYIVGWIIIPEGSPHQSDIDQRL